MALTLVWLSIDDKGSFPVCWFLRSTLCISIPSDDHLAVSSLCQLPMLSVEIAQEKRSIQHIKHNPHFNYYLHMNHDRAILPSVFLRFHHYSCSANHISLLIVCSAKSHTISCLSPLIL